MKITGSLLLAAMVSGPIYAAAPAQRISGLPFFFLENRGLTDPRAHYFLKRPELSAYFLEREIVLEIKSHHVAMRFVRSNTNARIEGAEPMAGRANFFLGGDSAKWVTDVPLQGAVVYRELWPGIDMVYAGNGRTLKSEFRVRAGADAGLVRWTYSAPFRASVSPDGSLSVSGEGMDLREDAPVIYQEKNGARIDVPGAFQTFADGSVGFRVSDYDRDLPLIIDPTLTFSTFIGGNGQDQGTAVALDPSGNAYMAGWTNSSNFAQSGPAKFRSYSGSMDAFVAKFSALGDKLVYCTYLGGSGDDRALALAVDSSGNAYLTGYTTSTNFPVSSIAPIQGRLAGKRNAFVTRLNSAGNGLVYSTYVGGEGTDTANGIAIDPSGHAFITGDTTSVGFPTTAGAFQRANTGGQDAFVAEVNLNGTTLLFSTYLGGSADDHAGAIAVSASGNVFVTGSTRSMDFPSVNAIQPTSGGNQDAFVTGLASGGKTLLFSTYLGGSGGTVGLVEEGDGIVLDSSSNIVVAGTTSSLNFPVTSTGFQQAYAGGNTDGFLTKLDPTGKTMIYSTYIGGSSVDHVTGVATDPVGYTYVAGYTASQDFPSMRGTQNSNRGEYDGFLCKLNPAGSGLAYATYIGGTGIDAVTGIAVDQFGSAVLGGYTASGDFPIAGVLGVAQKYKYGTVTAFLSKVTSGWIPIVADPVSSTIIFSIDQAHDRGSDGVVSTLRTFGFGQPGDTPVFGDWNGSGTTKVGIVRGNVWMLDYNGNGVWDGPSGGDRQFTFGTVGTPIVGDWNGSGTVKAGWVSSGYWTLDFSGLIQGVNTGLAPKSFYFGAPSDIPVVGDWSGNGVTKMGIVRAGVWWIDWNGDYIWDGRDRVFSFGLPTDKPVTGDWDGSGLSRPGVYRGGTWVLDYDSLAAMPFFGPIVKTSTFTFGSANSIPFVGK